MSLNLERLVIAFTALLIVLFLLLPFPNMVAAAYKNISDPPPPPQVPQTLPESCQLYLQVVRAEDVLYLDCRAPGEDYLSRGRVFVIHSGSSQPVAHHGIFIP